MHQVIMVQNLLEFVLIVVKKNLYLILDTEKWKMEK